MLKEQAAQISARIFNGVEEAIKQGATVESQEEDW